MIKGVDHYYTLPEVNLNIDYKGLKVSLEESILVCRMYIPFDWSDWMEGDFTLLSVLKLNDSKGIDDVEKGRSIFGDVRYFEPPKTRGKGKWSLIKEVENKRFITDCKDMVQCSLNVHEHPDKRKWFLFEKAGLSRKEREVFHWYPDHPFEQMESYGEMMLYYRLIVELIKENLTEFNLIFSREDWEKVLSLALKTIDFLKFTEDDVEELNYNFLVDFANAWNPSSS